VCAECPDFPCPRFKTDAEYQQLEESPSYPSYKAVMTNLRFVKEHGLDAFAARQKRRIELLERMIDGFDDGRSRSFFCRAACLRDAASLENALNEAFRKIKADHIKQGDKKARAKTLREILSGGMTK